LKSPQTPRAQKFREAQGGPKSGWVLLYADPSPIHKVDGLMEENYINFIFDIHMFGFHNPSNL
jgi:hypothetical protein